MNEEWYIKKIIELSTELGRLEARCEYQSGHIAELQRERISKLAAEVFNERDSGTDKRTDDDTWKS